MLLSWSLTHQDRKHDWVKNKAEDQWPFVCFLCDSLQICVRVSAQKPLRVGGASNEFYLACIGYIL